MNCTGSSRDADDAAANGREGNGNSIPRGCGGRGSAPKWQQGCCSRRFRGIRGFRPALHGGFAGAIGVQFRASKGGKNRPDIHDAAAAAERGILVTNTPGVLDEEVADLTLGLLLATLRRIPQADRYVRDGLWPEGPFLLSPTLVLLLNVRCRVRASHVLPEVALFLLLLSLVKVRCRVRISHTLREMT